MICSKTVTLNIDGVGGGGVKVSEQSRNMQ